MTMTKRSGESWIEVTFETSLSIIALFIIWYPMVYFLNEFAGDIFSLSMVINIVFVLSIGGAYPFIAGDWSLGLLGEFAFLLLLTVLAWGMIAFIIIISFSMDVSNHASYSRAIMWLLAYLTTYMMIFRYDVEVF